MTRENYEKIINKDYADEARKILLNQIDNYYQIPIYSKMKYNVGDEVILKKGTYLHGVPGMLDNFDWIVENGFIGNDFTNKSTANKINSSIGMWEIKETKSLRAYIEEYSGFTITYTIGRGPGSIEVSELIPYHKFDAYTEKINNREDVWTYWGNQTKEVRFMPSLVSDKRQLAFILNMESSLAKEMKKNDVWNTRFSEETVKSFVDYRYYEKFLFERTNRNPQTTNRETAIIFGLPPTLIEGIFVGRKLETDQKALNYIKEKLPDCYICNLDGKVIVGN